jgi:hypothetical protein
VRKRFEVAATRRYWFDGSATVVSVRLSACTKSPTANTMTVLEVRFNKNSFSTERQISMDSASTCTDARKHGGQGSSRARVNRRLDLTFSDMPIRARRQVPALSQLKEGSNMDAA